MSQAPPALSSIPGLSHVLPDGLTEIRRLPRFDWTWSNNKFKPPQQPDYLDLKQELSAQDFLKYLMGMLQVAYVRAYPIPQEMPDALQKNFDQTNAAMAASAQRMDQMNVSLPSMKNRPKVQPANQHGALAAAIAEYRNGTFVIEEQIWVKLMCMHSPINYGPETGAFSDSSMPHGADHPRAQGSIGRFVDPRRGGPAGRGRKTPSGPEVFAVYASRGEGAVGQDVRRFQRSHEGTARRVRARPVGSCTAAPTIARDHANSRHAIAQDWCDYALDRQTVTGPGGPVKISNAYNQTWTDGVGNCYQTNDSNANPNGVLKGNWTQMTQVHGDGTAK
jgi:hypothetical protein